MRIDYASNSDMKAPLISNVVACMQFTRLTLFMNLFLRETSQSPVNHRLKHVLKCILPALKAAEIAKFMALLDRRGRI